VQAVALLPDRGTGKTRSTPVRLTTDGTDRHTSLIPAYPVSSELTGSTWCSSYRTASMTRAAARATAWLVYPLPARIWYPA
jgi:hypothetical protein